MGTSKDWCGFIHSDTNTDHKQCGFAQEASKVCGNNAVIPGVDREVFADDFNVSNDKTWTIRASDFNVNIADDITQEVYD